MPKDIELICEEGDHSRRDAYELVHHTMAQLRNRNLQFRVTKKFENGGMVLSITTDGKPVPKMIRHPKPEQTQEPPKKPTGRKKTKTTTNQKPPGGSDEGTAESPATES